VRHLEAVPGGSSPHETALIEFLLDPHLLRTISDDEYRQRIDEIAAAFSVLSSDVAAAVISEAAAKHPDWGVRRQAVVALDRFVGEAWARNAICAATHDDVDWVAFTAIQLAGQHRIREAVKHLILISGWPSNFSRPTFARKPVGCGAAFTKQALWRIFGTKNPDTLRRMEDDAFAQDRQRVESLRREPDLEDTVLVHGGPFIAGATRAPIGPFQMDESDNPLRVQELPAFHIDRVCVTNERYQRFLTDAAANHEYCHPDEAPGKDHTPAHRRDRRFNDPALPVVGVDWYDGYAFARWAGGSLPSEDQWEKAARGRDGRTYPWGDEWDPAKANWVASAYGSEPSTLEALEALLTSTTPDWPRAPVAPADSYPEGASPYGALNMAGNVWELTRTNYFTHEDMAPFFRSRSATQFLHRPEAFHVLRGGTWTSPPVCLTAFFRGKDLITDRHNEVGFRCVYPA
jgi:gamma-glutamyl hercynylcysteine S-oxide synthase